MGDFKPNPGSFLPLLEMQRKRSFVPAEAASASPLAILEILNCQKHAALPLFDLQTRTNMAPARYGEFLKSLRDAGYIQIDGDAADQIVHLTTQGSEVVRLARPA